MENNYEIIPLFPIPLFVTTLPNSLSYISPWLNQRPMDNNNTLGGEYGEKSKDTYILDNKECKELKDIILKFASKYGNDTLGYNCSQYKFTQSWISFKHPDQSHIPHYHPNSVISGILYYDSIPLSECSSISFNNPHLNPTPKIFSPSIRIPPSDKLNVFTARTYIFPPTPGTLLLFPSSLLHSVPKNTTNEIRKSLAFNIVPTEGFGSEEELTKLKFN